MFSNVFNCGIHQATVPFFFFNRAFILIIAADLVSHLTIHQSVQTCLKARCTLFNTGNTWFKPLRDNPPTAVVAISENNCNEQLLIYLSIQNYRIPKNIVVPPVSSLFYPSKCFHNSELYSKLEKHFPSTVNRLIY